MGSSWNTTWSTGIRSTAARCSLKPAAYETLAQKLYILFATAFPFL